MVPGDPERRNWAQRAASGIPLDDATWQSLVDAGLAVGMSRVDFPEPAGG